MTRSSSKRPATAGIRGATLATEARLTELRRLHLQGHSHPELRRHCRDAWGISDRQARRLLVLLGDQLRIDWEAARPGYLGSLIARTEHVLRRSLEAENMPVALGCLRHLSRLSGHDAPDPGAWLAQVLAAIDAAQISQTARTNVHLMLAARGLGPMPDLSRLRDDELKAIAEGRLLPQDEPIDVGGLEVEE